MNTITLMRVDAQLAAVRQFWDSLRGEAKKTMHGWLSSRGATSSSHPGAGLISRAVGEQTGTCSD